MNLNANAPAGPPGQCLKQRHMKAQIVDKYYHTTPLLKSPLTAKGGAT